MENERQSSNTPSRPDAQGAGVSTQEAENSKMEPRRKAWYFQKKVLIPIALLIIAGLAVFWYWDTYLRGYVSTDDAYIAGNRVAISSKMLGRITELTVASTSIWPSSRATTTRSITCNTPTPGFAASIAMPPSRGWRCRSAAKSTSAG